MRKSIIAVAVLAIVSMFSINAMADMNDGLFAHYAFNGNANDSIKGNHGKVYNAKLTDDRNGNPNSAYRFDGSNDYIVIPNSADFDVDDGVSISFEMKREANQSGSYYKGYLFRRSTVGFSIAIYDKGLIKWSDENLAYTSTMDWAEYIFTVDSQGNSKLYENRILVDTGYQRIRLYGDLNLIIGKLDLGTSKASFNGCLDEIKIWNRELSEEEITAPVMMTMAAPAFPEDKWAPAGSVHAHDNMIWAPNNKIVSVTLDGYVRDELSIAKNGNGHGVSEAYIMVNDDRYELIDYLDADGYYSFDIEVQAVKGAHYDVQLFASDTNSEPNSGMVDSTYIYVPENMGNGKKK